MTYALPLAIPTLTTDRLTLREALASTLILPARQHGVRPLVEQVAHGAGLVTLAAIAAPLLFAAFVFFMPNSLGEPDNYIPANPLSTPAHILPEWYFWPFYAILRAFTTDFLGVPAKLWGVLAMFASILLLFLLPWLDTSPVRSNNYRPLSRLLFWVFSIRA